MIEAREGAAVGLRRCIEFAQRLGGSVHVIDATEPTPRWLLVGRGDHSSEEQRIQERRVLLERFVSNVRSDGVDVSVATRRGRRIVELIREVREAYLDLLVLVTDAAAQSLATSEAFANRVVRKSPVPVLVLRPLPPGNSGTVVALDISSADDSDVLVDAIIARAIDVASKDSPITLVHVLEILDSPTASSPDIDEVARPAIDVCRRRLEQLAVSLGRTGTVSIEVRVGRPVDEIAAVVRKCQPELLVVGTVSRSGPAGLMFGNTAESLLREIACSVLAVKPPGFRSPVS